MQGGVPSPLHVFIIIMPGKINSEENKYKKYLKNTVINKSTLFLQYICYKVCFCSLKSSLGDP